jgi:triosephosphate isomerase
MKKNRKNIVAGNWKMNLSLDEGRALLAEISSDAASTAYIFPPAIYLNPLLEMAREKGVSIGAQNAYFEDAGAFTGEVSMAQLKNMGMDAVLIGHSERRSIFKEDDLLVKNKVDAALTHGLTPFLCCGETHEERNTKQHFDVVKKQITNSLFHLDIDSIVKIVVAYEPVWAIGTGETASAEQAEEMHEFIRSLMERKYGIEIAQSISILYGGSCKPGNAKELFNQPNIDGGLIGGASLKAKDFNQIIASF